MNEPPMAERIAGRGRALKEGIFFQKNHVLKLVISCSFTTPCLILVHVGLFLVLMAEKESYGIFNKRGVNWCSVTYTSYYVDPPTTATLDYFGTFLLTTMNWPQTAIDLKPTQPLKEIRLGLFKVWMNVNSSLRLKSHRSNYNHMSTRSKVL